MTGRLVQLIGLFYAGVCPMVTAGLCHKRFTGNSRSRAYLIGHFTLGGIFTVLFLC
ncbi:hypothetical protein [Dehalobacter restrictus]|uniref:Uncharacterized protein n=1 Tax=Dehalobacter restrictus (strain DSM 9455 / PER-K23) TaxID=871738 RepID=A0ABN4BVT6_DEHRP|nr:hypothetical protein [Dehalobacter restrictus]AHF11324.1 hypothetical protein DEHRE_06125 [Dehalobacter restrictus DSM 9455]